MPHRATNQLGWHVQRFDEELGWVSAHAYPYTYYTDEEDAYRILQNYLNLGENYRVYPFLSKEKL